MEKKTVAIGLGAVAAIGALIYFATRAKAAPPTEYCCPYCPECFPTCEELVAHVELAHPGERIPLPIEWE